MRLEVEHEPPLSPPLDPPALLRSADGRPRLRARVLVPESVPIGARVRVSLEAFDATDAAEPSRRIRPKWFTVPADRWVNLGAPALPAAPATGVRFVARLEAEGRVEEQASPAEGLHAIRDGDRDTVGVVVHAPSIFEHLQDRAPLAQVEGGHSDVDAVVAFVTAQLGRDLDALLDRDDYPPVLPDEIGEDGRPLAPSSRLAAWQRFAIVHLSGHFYSAAARRDLQWLEHGVGYPLAQVCNNLVDTLLWLRGADLDPHGGTGIPAALTHHEPRAMTRLRQLLERHPDGFLEDLTRGGSPSYERARPGSVFLWEGHINVVLRVRRVGSATRLQLFDTGGVRTPAPPHGVGTRSNVLGEQGWVSRMPSFEAAGGVKAHAWFPLATPARTPPPWPLCRPHLGPELCRLYPPGTALVDESQDGHAPDADVGGALRSQARAPAAHLVVTERVSGRRWISGPVALGVPLTALFGSVCRLPGSEAWEARWLVRVGGSWRGALNEGQRHGRQSDVALELYNDRGGVARLYRMSMGQGGARPPSGFASILDAGLVDALRHMAPREPESEDGRRDAALTRAAGGSPHPLPTAAGNAVDPRPRRSR